ncbi:hypothetical protein AB9X29_003776 [Vibrio vulnificus]
MKIGYNKSLNLIVKNNGEYVSCFSLSEEKATSIVPNIAISEQYPVDMVDVTEGQLSALWDAHVEERYKVISGIYVPRDAKRSQVKTLLDAYRNRTPVLLEYREGYEMFDDDACATRDGLNHVCYVGKTTGSMKSLIHLTSPNSVGGPLLSFSGLKSVTAIPM